MHRTSRAGETSTGPASPNAPARVATRGRLAGRLLLPVLALSAVIGCKGGEGARAKSVDPSASEAASAATLDRLLEAEWQAAGVTPAPIVDDATFLRRASLDLLGRVATAEELRAFLADASPDKRATLIGALLDRPEHATHLARVWERLLMGPEVKNRVADRAALRRWLNERFASDAPWDRMVSELVAAEGRNSVGGRRGPALYADDADRAAEEREAGVNGATNYTLRFARSPADLAGTTSRVFLGVQIQCAQCHDHKTESWKQADFRGFESTFIHVRADVIDRDKGELPVFDLAGADAPNRRLARRSDDAALAEVEPRSLDGASLAGDDPRASLAKWMTSKDNAWFSRAMTNRVWSELMGGGFVEPIDDFRPSNPATMQPVLDHLAEDFEASGFDLDHLYRAICTSTAYGRGLGGGDETPRAARFAHQALRPLDADQLLDSIFVATDADKLIDERAPDQAELIKSLIRRRMGFVFDADSEANGEPVEATLQQTFFTMNGPVPTAATSLRDGGLLDRLVARDDVGLIDELFARTLGRAPSAADVAAAKALLAAPHGEDPEPDRAALRGRRGGKGKGKKGALSDPKVIAKVAQESDAEGDRERGAEDLFWALINSSEFGFRR